MRTKTVEFTPRISEEIALRSAELKQIDASRRELLDALAKSIDASLSASGAADLTFICTHNSRRSHLSMVWAQVAADHYGIGGIRTFSGGTEATAFDRRAVATLERCGFEIDRMDESSNPLYAVHYGTNVPALPCSSKVLDDEPNPNSNFIAVMTCSSADRDCPYVAGAVDRVALPYEDPKAFDGTDREAAMYDERRMQIARELLYVFSRVAQMRNDRLP